MNTSNACLTAALAPLPRLWASLAACGLLGLAACAEPIPERSRADEIPLAEPSGGDPDEDAGPGSAIGEEGRTDPLLSVVTLADGALLGNANVATCTFTSQSDRMLFQTAVPDDTAANPRGVARVSGEPVLFTAAFAGSQARMEEGGRYAAEGDLVAELVRGDAATAGTEAASDASGTAEGIETRSWPATLTIAYAGTALSTRNQGTWSCGN